MGTEVDSSISTGSSGLGVVERGTLGGVFFENSMESVAGNYSTPFDTYLLLSTNHPMIITWHSLLL